MSLLLLMLNFRKYLCIVISDTPAIIDNSLLVLFFIIKLSRSHSSFVYIFKYITSRSVSRHYKEAEAYRDIRLSGATLSAKITYHRFIRLTVLTLPCRSCAVIVNIETASGKIILIMHRIHFKLLHLRRIPKLPVKAYLTLLYVGQHRLYSQLLARPMFYLFQSRMSRIASRL